MIHAFALEPEVVARWAQSKMSRLLFSQIGAGHPRIMLMYPVKDWTDKVYQAAADLELEQRQYTALDEWIRHLKVPRCQREGPSYDESLTWLENAEQEYERQPYRGVVASQNPRRNSMVVLAEDLPLDKAKIWHECKARATCARSPSKMAGLLKPMLANSKELHIVDPFFRPDDPATTKLVAAFIEEFGLMASSREVRIHCRHTPPWGDPIAREVFESDAVKKFAPQISSDVTVKFSRLANKEGGNDIHNRYLLTNIGGVMTGKSYREDEPGRIDDVMVLSEEQWGGYWNEFVREEGFVVVDKPRAIRGRRESRQRQ